MAVVEAEDSEGCDVSGFSTDFVHLYFVEGLLP